MDDLEKFLKGNNDSGILIGDLVLTILMFADDMAVFGNSVEDLQNKLNLLHDYCINWGLEVNSNKTKIMVFRKRGGLKSNEKWKYNGVDVEDMIMDFHICLSKQTTMY